MLALSPAMVGPALIADQPACGQRFSHGPARHDTDLLRQLTHQGPTFGSPSMITCSICGGRTFSAHKVLWPSLIAEWELLPEEVEYIDRQQGTRCVTCGANLRVMALGQAIQDVLHTILPLRDYVVRVQDSELKVLDINGCDALSPELQRMPQYVRANFPELDMCAMPYSDGSFDLVVHSDTLEHVSNPLLGLEECCRVLKPGGRLCFTVPIVVNRLTTDRAKLPKSYHGDPQKRAEDYVVHTEFGADAWTLPMRAGFDNVTLKQIEHPAAHAISAWRNPGCGQTP
jgi:SAM-dependent methyltransferase